MVRGLIALVAAGLFAIPSSGAPFDVPIDTGQSTLTFQLCIAGSCDSDSSQVAGTVAIELDSVDDPGLLWLHDFDLQLTEDLQVSISWGPFGSFSASATGVAMTYAQPGLPMGPAIVSASSFALTDVPADGEGALTYTASGIPCFALEAASIPCSDTRYLEDEGTQAADEFSGTVTSVSRVVSLVSNIDVTAPLDEENPDLGTIRVFGTVRGEVFVPLPEPGDIDQDGDVDLADHALFAGCLSGPNVSTVPAGCSASDFEAADLDDDSDVDLGDHGLFAAYFTG